MIDGGGGGEGGLCAQSAAAVAMSSPGAAAPENRFGLLQRRRCGWGALPAPPSPHVNQVASGPRMEKSVVCVPRATARATAT